MSGELIYKQLSLIMNAVDPILKARRNEQQGYNFRGIDDIYNSLHGLFKDNHVIITSNVLESRREERTSTRGGVLIYTILKCEFSFYAEDGSSVKSITEGEAMDSGDKSTNKAMSAALKYALMQMFLIPTSGNNDSENESPEPAPRQQPKQSSKQTKTQPSHEEVDKRLGDLAIAYAKASNIEEVQQLWTKNKDLQKNPAHLKLKDTAKARLTNGSK